MEEIITTSSLPHSAEYLKDYRDFWWNLDFLKLMAKRLGFDQVSTVLDVGCGIGHFGQILSSVLPEKANIAGIDREEVWVQKATERALKMGLANRYHYQQGDANHLPFADESFDLVICQTLLIHVADPKKTLQEMIRVTKPGGLILTVEPNNLAAWLLLSSLFPHQDLEEMIDVIRFAIICEKGKEKSGLGFNSLGDLIPGYMSELKLTEIKTYLSDKASPLFPPYEGEEQEEMIKQYTEWNEREFWVWDKDETKLYFLAGGGDEKQFENHWKNAINMNNKMQSAILQKSYHAAGGMLMYLTSGRKSIYTKRT